MATYYLLIRYNVNGGKIRENPYYYSSGYTSYTSYTASTSYKYMKATSTSANVVGCATASGTYANFQSRVASTTTYPNLMNVATFHIWRGGYHIVGTSAYRTTSTGGNLINQDYSSSSTTNPATYARMGGSTSANKTVTLYVNWTANNYTVQFNANGGTGTMSNVTCTYGTGKALTNTFTRTGYTFAGWACARPFVSSYADCDPVPNAAPTSYSGTTLDSISYLTVNSITYAWIRSHTHRADGDDINYTKLVEYNTSNNTWDTVYSGNLEGNICAIGQFIYLRYDVNSNNEYMWRRLTGTIWNTARTLNTTDDYTYADGASVTNLTWTNNGTATAYAVWTPKTTPISFDMNGGTGGPSSPVTATYNQTFLIPTVQPTSNKYFMGWAYAIGFNAQTATNSAHLRADSGIIDYIGGESFTWTAAGGYGVYCAVWSPIAIRIYSGQWERLFNDRDGIWGEPCILEDGETIGLQSGSYWYKFNGTSWIQISAPSSYTNFSNNYNDCNPKPNERPTYTGVLNKERYASINGVTYGYIESSTSNYDYTSLHKLGSNWKGTFPKIKVNGVWKDPTAYYLKVNGAWQQLTTTGS